MKIVFLAFHSSFNKFLFFATHFSKNWTFSDKKDRTKFMKQQISAVRKNIKQ